MGHNLEQRITIYDRTINLHIQFMTTKCSVCKFFKDYCNISIRRTKTIVKVKRILKCIPKQKVIFTTCAALHQTKHIIRLKISRIKAGNSF